MLKNKQLYFAVPNWNVLASIFDFGRLFPESLSYRVLGANLLRLGQAQATKKIGRSSCCSSSSSHCVGGGECVSEGGRKD